MSISNLLIKKIRLEITMQTDSIDNIVAEVPEKKLDALGRAYIRT